MIIALTIAIAFSIQAGANVKAFELARKDYLAIWKSNRVSPKYSAEFERIAVQEKSKPRAARAWTYALISAPKDFDRELAIMDHLYELPISDSLADLLPKFLEFERSFEAHHHVIELPELVLDRSRSKSIKAAVLLAKADFLTSDDVLKWDLYNFVASEYSGTRASYRAHRILVAAKKLQQGQPLARATSYAKYRIEQSLVDFRQRKFGLERRFFEAEDLYRRWLERDTFFSEPDPNFRISEENSKEFERMATEAGDKPFAVLAWTAALCSAPKNVDRENRLIDHILATKHISRDSYSHLSYYVKVFLLDRFAVGDRIHKVAKFIQANPPKKF